MSGLWQYFEVLKEDQNCAKCTLCGQSFSRGGGEKKNYGTSNLTRHLSRGHPVEYDEVFLIKKKGEKRKLEDKEEKDSENIKIFNLKTKKARETVIQTTMNGFVRPTKMLTFHSDAAQKIHRSIFEMIVVDCEPFSIVNQPGFIRSYAQARPDFQLGSAMYYRNLLEPSYEKVRNKIQGIIQKDSPKSISAGLDGWSSQHHGYIGINVSYISNWVRKDFNIACTPFDIQHTAINIHDSFEGKMCICLFVSRTGTVGSTEH